MDLDVVEACRRFGDGDDSDPWGAPSVLVLSPDRALCDTVEQILDPMGIQAITQLDPFELLDEGAAVLFHIVLLDVWDETGRAMRLLEFIQDGKPFPKAIVFLDPAHHRVVTESIRRGAFDCLEKPLRAHWLVYAVQRAFRTQKAEIALTRAANRMQEMDREIQGYQGRLQDAKQKLKETSGALSILAKNLENTRLESERRVVSMVRSLILPLLDKLQSQRHIAVSCGTELFLLNRYLHDLTSCFHTESRVADVLSQSELRIASMIKNGMSCEGIAEHLNVSIHTVRTHRRNIRKKLGLAQSKTNLRTYLLHQSNALQEGKGERTPE